MAMFKKVLIFMGILLGLMLVYVGIKPGDYFIKRQILLPQKAEVIFPYLVSMKQADEWMPWKDSDPQVKNFYSGPDAGIGSVSHWESSGPMGVGSAEVIAVIPDQKVTTRISYMKPMEMNQISEFILTPQGESTILEWNVKGYRNYIFRLVGFVMGMDIDQYVGGEFEKGLNKLKHKLEIRE
jgi:hypothetical protein